MELPSTMRLLSQSKNERGDLFTRVVKDLFFGLGYDNLILDLPVPGRELDIQGEHRFEPRRVIAECKAHADPIGGADVNKFLGVLTRERVKHATQSVSGYFVSLSGFTSTAIEQERESGSSGVILFSAEKIISELQRNRFIVPMSEAMRRAGECAQICNLNDAQTEAVELVCGKLGYIWVVYFGQNKERTHFSLIHADGTPLSMAVAQQLIQADKRQKGKLKALKYLGPRLPEPSVETRRAETLGHYRKWLGEECGYIQLDGLPADNDLSATKLRLEKLFIPLKATYSPKKSDPATLEELPEIVTEPIGILLEGTPHLAILASPGGGKSTLLKRLATAYAYPDRRKEVSDALPDREWLPLYIRCRDLRDRAQRPLLELLRGITAFANMDDTQANHFQVALSEALRHGEALLLVDGLDEISDEGARRVFAQNLRTFIGMFPQVAFVVTSRLAGFRDIAGVIASVCRQVSLASLDEDDVRHLCVSWHVEVITDSEKVRKDAADLAALIWRNPRIRTLAENPLLLTTLLVVKRWIGEIPPNRARLYSEAVRVLVRTWNVEGYAPLDEDETLARLSYVACAMLERGVQTVGQTALIKLLGDAGNELEAELQFATVSPINFLQRIEYRSSLLMQTGYQRIDNEFQPVFEFRHLTFQEYLAARGFVEEQYPGRNAGRDLVEILSPHWQDQRWQEVIPLAAVLSGRKADRLIQAITEASDLVDEYDLTDVEQKGKIVSLLGQCLLDEVTITSTTLRNALAEVGRKGSLTSRGWIADLSWSGLINGKFGKTLREVVETEYLSGKGQWSLYDAAFSQCVRIETLRVYETLFSVECINDVGLALCSMQCEERIRGALLAMRLSFETVHKVDPTNKDANRKAFTEEVALAHRAKLIDMVMSDDLPCVQAACWALAWMGNLTPEQPPLPVTAIAVLWRYVQDTATGELSRKAAWALSAQPLYPRDALSREFWGDCDVWLEREWKVLKIANERSEAVIVVAWYRRGPWTDEQLSEMMRGHRASGSNERNIRKMLAEMDTAGMKLLKELNSENAERKLVS